MRKLLPFVISAAVGLCACSEQKSRVYKKQRTPTAIKIDKIDLSLHSLALRFNYRSYVEKTLNNINCEVSFNKDSILNINKSVSLELGAFATEILKFDNIKINNSNNIQNQTVLNYTLFCNINYNKGQEVVRESSELHLIPGGKLSYR